MEYNPNHLHSHPIDRYNNNPPPENDDFDLNEEYERVRNTDSPRD